MLSLAIIVTKDVSNQILEVNYKYVSRSRDGPKIVQFLTIAVKIAS